MPLTSKEFRKRAKAKEEKIRNELNKMQYINIKPSWQYAMSVYIMGLTQGNEEGKKQAAKALMELAKQLDEQGIK